MKIHEFQAKRLLKAAGIRVPKGELASTPDRAKEIGGRLDCDSWVVKAQIRAGGRGKGAFADGKPGIRIADSIGELWDTASEMIGKTLVTDQSGPEGLPVKTVYIEQKMEIDNEVGLSVLVDQQNREVVALLSEKGGIEIEAAAKKDPGSIHKMVVDITGKIPEQSLKAATDNLKLSESQRADLHNTVNRVVEMFFTKDAALIEINPLGLCNGKWVALDAKMMFDKNALFRQGDMADIEKEDTQEERFKHASFDGFNYLAMGGNIGCMAVGAGLSMATIDAIRDIGGNPGNFLDLPPDSKVNRVVRALDLLLGNPEIKCILVNVFGGGIMRCDTVSDAITLVQNSKGINIPVVVRLAGTNAELAKRRLRESMPQVYLAANLAEAAQQAVARAQSPVKEEKPPGSPTLLSRLKSLLGD